MTTSDARRSRVLNTKFMVETPVLERIIREQSRQRTSTYLSLFLYYYYILEFLFVIVKNKIIPSQRDLKTHEYYYIIID